MGRGSLVAGGSVFRGNVGPVLGSGLVYRLSGGLLLGGGLLPIHGEGLAAVGTKLGPFGKEGTTIRTMHGDDPFEKNRES